MEERPIAFFVTAAYCCGDVDDIRLPPWKGSVDEWDRWDNDDDTTQVEDGTQVLVFGGRIP